MRISSVGLDFIKKHEGLRLKAYPDPGTNAEPYTIGYGLTRYPNGVKVKLGDVITKQEADDMFTQVVDQFANRVDELIKTPLKQNQFDALVSLAYNIGVGAFKSSTVLRKVNLNPDDPTIDSAFRMWNKAGGRIMKGLQKRRVQESELYFKQ